MPRMKGGPHTTNKNWRDGYDEIFGKKGCAYRKGVIDRAIEENVHEHLSMCVKEVSEEVRKARVNRLATIDLDRLKRCEPSDVCPIKPDVDNPYIIVEKGAVDLEQLKTCKPGDLFFNEADAVPTETYDSLIRSALYNDVRESARRSVQVWCDPYAVVTKGTAELFEAMSIEDRHEFLVEHHLISLFQKYSNYWEGKNGMVDFIKEIEEKNTRIDSALYNNAHVVKEVSEEVRDGLGMRVDAKARVNRMVTIDLDQLKSLMPGKVFYVEPEEEEK